MRARRYPFAGSRVQEKWGRLPCVVCLDAGLQRDATAVVERTQVKDEGHMSVYVGYCDEHAPAEEREEGEK